MTPSAFLICALSLAPISHRPIDPAIQDRVFVYKMFKEMITQGNDAIRTRALFVGPAPEWAVWLSKHEAFYFVWHKDAPRVAGGVIASISGLPFLRSMDFLFYGLASSSNEWVSMSVLSEIVHSLKRTGFLFFDARDNPLWRGYLKGFGWKRVPFLFDGLDIWEMKGANHVRDGFGRRDQFHRRASDSRIETAA